MSAPSLQPDMLSLLPDVLSLFPHTPLPVPCPHLISLPNLSSLYSPSQPSHKHSLPSHEHSLAKTSSSLPNYRLLSPDLINSHKSSHTSHKSSHTYQTMTIVPLAGGTPPRMWDMQLLSLCPPPPCPSPT